MGAPAVVGARKVRLRASPPEPAAGLIPRTTLVERLTALPGASLAMLVAPLGYGKSTLLRAWAEADARAFAVVRLRPADDDPLELVRSIAAALEAVSPSMRSRRTPAQLASTLRASDLEFVLVLDDAHTLRHPDAVETIGMLVDSLGPNARMAIASRTELPLPVARLRTERRLVELHAADLVLTRAEIAQLAAASSLVLDDAGLELLAARTEGWAAGVYLATLAVAGDPHPVQALGRFGGDDRLVADYMREEVLSPLPPELVDFLVKTSITERLTGALCDHLLERHDAARVLAELARRNVPIVPLDRTGTEYRYHSLFAGALRAELRALDPALEAVLHTRASSFFEAGGEPDPALDHAIAAGDIDHAAALVWREAASVLAYGSAAKLTADLGHFSREQIRSSPPLALAAATAHLLMGDRALVEHWTAAASEALAGDDSPASDKSLEPAARLLRAAVAESDLAGMRRAAAEACALAPEDSPWRALACLVEGAALHLTGYRTAARERLEEGVRRGAALAPAIQALCLAQLALLVMDDDDWEAASSLAAHARAQVERVGVGDHPTSALVFAASAAACAHFGRVEACERDARHADRLLSELAGFTPWYVAECSIALANAALRLGALPRARSLLAEAERELKPLPDATVARGWIDDCKGRVDTVSAARSADAERLTTAELRILQFLPTHLSFPEIAERLYVSTNTVKTHARAVYRKLSASSRSEAVLHARAAGLLDGAA